MKSKSSASSGKIGAGAVTHSTGKSWDQWFQILDKAGGSKMDHQQIVALLNKKYRLNGWWAQMVTVAFEIERGLREKYETPKGYEVSIGKTISVPAKHLFDAWSNSRIRKRWLNEKITVKRATPEKSMRITWSDGKTSLNVNFYRKSEMKSQVVVQHGKLKNSRDAQKMKSYWKETLERLNGALVSKSK